MIKESLKKTKIYNKNNIKFIKSFFKIPPNIDLKNFNSNEYYDFKYIQKNNAAKEEEKNRIKNMTPSEKKEYRHSKYLNIEKCKIEVLNNRPRDFNTKKYRRIIDFKKNDNYIWLKCVQRKINKMLSKAIDNSCAPYLHSTLKKVSYATNAKKHIGEKYTLLIDLCDFFSNIDINKVQYTFAKYFDLDPDIAKVYSLLVTAPKDEPPYHENIYVLGQGLPSSPMLAFLCNESLFEYIYKLAMKYSIEMTVYVDDVIFSSENIIPQKFIDTVFGLFTRNGLKINKKKFHYCRNKTIKQITGLLVSNGCCRVKNSKREEIKVIYDKLYEEIHNVKTIDDYFKVYNLFLKFRGNFQHLIEVECKNNFKTIIPIQYKKYQKLVEKYRVFFVNGLKRENKNKPYSMNNILQKNKAEINTLFQKLVNFNNTNI